MTTFEKMILCVALALAGVTGASAADDVPEKPPRLSLKAKPVAEKSFFLINDNRITYAYFGAGAAPGYTKKASVNTLAFTHFDA